MMRISGMYFALLALSAGLLAGSDGTEAGGLGRQKFLRVRE
jgi:hypothetical protein